MLIDKTGAQYLLLSILVAKLFTAQPRMLSVKAGTATWLVVLLAGLVALIGYAVLLLLLRRFPGQSLPQINRAVFGRAAGGVVSSIYCIYLVLGAGLVLREFVGAFKIAVMPQTPLAPLMILFLFVVLYASFKGLETLARMAAYLVPILIILLLLTILGTLRLMDLTELAPIWGFGISHTLLLSLPESSLYSEILVLGVMASMLNPSDLNQVGLKALLWSIVALTAVSAVLHATFPFPAVTRLSFPMLDLTRAVEISEFLQRIEAIFVFLWFFVAGFKLSLSLSSTALVFTEMAGLADFRPLLPALGLLTYTLGFIPDSIVAATWLDSEWIRTWSWTVAFGLPGLTILVALLRGKRGVTNGNSLPSTAS